MRRAGHGFMIIAGLLLLFALGCGAPRSATTPGLPALQEGGGASADPKYGGVMLLGMNDTPENMNVYASTARGTSLTFNHFFEPLVALDQSKEWRIDLPVIPWLAESWQDNGTSITFKIRPGVKWHDGRPLTNQDVAWSLNYLRDPDNKFVNRNYLAQVTDVQPEGTDTVRLTLKEPTPYFFAILREVMILPKHVFDAGGAEALNNKSVGTGPFTLASMERTSRTVFKKFPDYWRKDDKGRQQPYLDGLELVHNMDLSAQRAAFAAGMNDVLSFPDRTELNAFAQRIKDFKSIEFHYANGPSFAVNVKRRPFDNPDVRKAAFLVLDRKEVNDNFSSGEGLYTTPIIPAMKTGWGITQEELLQRPGWRANKNQDLEEAKRLLQKAGVSPGDVEFRVIATATWTTVAQAEIAVGQFRRFGFNVRYDTLDGATFNKEFRSANWDLAWQVQFSHQEVTRPGFQFFHSKGGNNFGGVNDPEVDALVEQLSKAVKPEDQKRLGRQLQDLVIDRAYLFPSIDQKLFHIVQPWINDYFTGRSNQQDVQGTSNFIWIDTERLPANRK